MTARAEDTFIDDLVDGWHILSAAPVARPAAPGAHLNPVVPVVPAVEQAPDTWVFRFGCAVYGGPWAEREQLPRADAAALAAGTNPVGSRPKLLRRATVRVAGHAYVFAAFGTRGSPAAELGELETKAFQGALRTYRGSGGSNAECFVVRIDNAGGPVSFAVDDPFLGAFFPRYA